MDLYLLRHAIAVDRGATGYEIDSMRPLTPEGARKMERAAQGMRALNLSFDLILSSPYLRAKQTAEIVARVLRSEDRLELAADLAPGGNRMGLIESLNQHPSQPESVLLVGHEPDMGELISMLTAGNFDLLVVMKKGGLCKLSAESLHYGRCASLCWLLTPRQLTLMA